MGQEIKCKVEFGNESSEGKALLETSEVLFRGGFRLKIPFQTITGLEAAAGKLKIQFTEGSATFHLGPAAEKWAAKIRNPPSRLDKLGVKPGTRVRLINKHDDDFRRGVLSIDEDGKRRAELLRLPQEWIVRAVQRSADDTRRESHSINVAS